MQVVTHGGTLTTSVTFKECVKAVGKHAFSTSPYPVILTLENHVKHQQVGSFGSTNGVLPPTQHGGTLLLHLQQPSHVVSPGIAGITSAVLLGKR